MQVSVIIPTQNRPDRLTRCVGSVLRQLLPPDEIVIVNDGSDVEYGRALDTIRRSAHEANVTLKYLSHDRPIGAAVARNAGVRQAGGDILMFIDDDDTWRPAKIYNQLEIFRARSDVGLVYSGRNVIDEQGNLLYRITPRHQGDVGRRIFQRNVVGTTSSVAIRRSIFETAGGFDEGMPAKQDYELWMRVCQHAPIAFDVEHTVNWTVHLDASEQMAGRPHLYEQAYRRMRCKHRAAWNQLSAVERRRARSHSLTTIADKYARSGGFQQYIYAARAVVQWPSLAALSRLLPYRTWLYLRTVFTSQ